MIIQAKTLQIKLYRVSIGTPILKGLIDSSGMFKVEIGRGTSIRGAQRSVPRSGTLSEAIEYSEAIPREAFAVRLCLTATRSLLNMGGPAHHQAPPVAFMQQ